MAVHSRIMQLEIVKQILSNQSVRYFPHLIMVGAESSAWQACMWHLCRPNERTQHAESRGVMQFAGRLSKHTKPNRHS